MTWLPNKTMVSGIEGLVFLEPEHAPLYLLMRKLQSQPNFKTEFAWLEDELVPYPGPMEVV